MSEQQEASGAERLGLETVPVVLQSTMGADEWELKLPLDIPVQSLIRKFVTIGDLGFRERDEDGYLLPWQLLWREGGRYLDDVETLRGAGVQPGNQLVMAMMGHGGGTLDLRWADVGIRLSSTENPHNWYTHLPLDVTALDLIRNFARNPTLSLRPFDSRGRSLAYRLMWREGNRALADAETLRRAGVRDGDALVIVGEPAESATSETATAQSRSAAEPPKGKDRKKIFIGYSHKDGTWLDRLKVHLKPLERKGLVDAWDDTKIKPGMRWQTEVERALSQASVAVLLVSGDFLASDFVGERELPALLDVAAGNGVKILPIIVRPCLLEHEPDLAQYQTVNPPSRPLSGMDENEQEQALVNVARIIMTFMKTE